MEFPKIEKVCNFLFFYLKKNRKRRDAVAVVAPPPATIMVGAFQPGKMHRPASTPFRPRYNSAVTVVHVLAFLTATATTATPPHAPATPSPFATPSSNPSLPPQPLHQHPGFESRHDHDHLHHHHHEEEAEAEAEGRGGEEEEEEDGFMSVGRVHCMTEAEEDDSSAAHVAATTLLREAALLRQRNGGRHRRLGLTGGEEGLMKGGRGDRFYNSIHVHCLQWSHPTFPHAVQAK